MSAAVTMGQSVSICTCTPCAVGIGIAAACGGVARQIICPACLLSGESETAEYMQVLQLAMSSPPRQHDANEGACEQRCDHASNVDHVVAPCPGFRVADGETALGEGAGGGEVFHTALYSK